MFGILALANYRRGMANHRSDDPKVSLSLSIRTSTRDWLIARATTKGYPTPNACLAAELDAQAAAVAAPPPAVVTKVTSQDQVHTYFKKAKK